MEEYFLRPCGLTSLVCGSLLKTSLWSGGLSTASPVYHGRGMVDLMVLPSTNWISTGRFMSTEFITSLWMHHPQSFEYLLLMNCSNLLDARQHQSPLILRFHPLRWWIPCLYWWNSHGLENTWLPFLPLLKDTREDHQRSRCLKSPRFWCIILSFHTLLGCVWIMDMWRNLWREGRGLWKFEKIMKWRVKKVHSSGLAVIFLSLANFSTKNPLFKSYLEFLN